MSPAAIYVHYESKSELLFELCRIGHTALLREVAESVDRLDAPAESLEKLVKAFVIWHAQNHTLAGVIQRDVDNITPEQYDEIRDLKLQLEAFLRAELQRGIESGDFLVTDVDATTWALLSLGLDVARWWTDRSAASDELSAAYAALALRMVGVAQ